MTKPRQNTAQSCAYFNARVLYLIHSSPTVDLEDIQRVIRPQPIVIEPDMACKTVELRLWESNRRKRMHPWRIPAYLLFILPSVTLRLKRYSSLLITMGTASLAIQFAYDWWIPPQRASNAETGSIWWRHHEWSFSNHNLTEYCRQCRVTCMQIRYCSLSYSMPIESAQVFICLISNRFYKFCYEILSHRITCTGTIVWSPLLM